MTNILYITAGTSIQITAQYGGAVQMGEDSIVTVEDADRFTQGPMSNAKSNPLISAACFIFNDTNYTHQQLYGIL